MQALASQLADHHDTTDLADIHLLVKRKLTAMKIGEGGVCQVGRGHYPSILSRDQGAEERSSLLSKLLFARYKGRGGGGSIKEGLPRSPLSFLSLPSSRSCSPLPLRRSKAAASCQDRPRPLSAVFSSSSLKQLLPSTTKLRWGPLALRSSSS